MFVQVKVIEELVLGYLKSLQRLIFLV